MYHQDGQPVVTEKQMAASNWLRIFWDKGYTQEEIDTLMAELYGVDWEDACFPGK